MSDTEVRFEFSQPRCCWPICFAMVEETVFICLEFKPFMSAYATECANFIESWFRCYEVPSNWEIIYETNYSKLKEHIVSLRKERNLPPIEDLQF
jgi:hypothetical protein